jgi:hypothetical protein
VAAHHDLEGTVEELASFLRVVLARKAELQETVRSTQTPEGSLLGYLLEEVRWGSLDLGLPSIPPGVESLLIELGREPR